MVSNDDQKMLNDFLDTLATVDRAQLIRLIMELSIVESQETARENIEMITAFLTKSV
jgi:hypothetical protein